MCYALQDREDEAPEWADKLTTLLQGNKREVASVVKQESLISAVEHIKAMPVDGQKPWAIDLINQLEGNIIKQEADQSTCASAVSVAEEKQSRLATLASRLKPKGSAITLRHGGVLGTATKVDPGEAHDESQLETAVPVAMTEAELIAKETHGLSGEELEKRTLQALKSIKQRRAAEAKVSAQEKAEAKKLEKELRAKAAKAEADASAAAAAKGGPKAAVKHVPTTPAPSLKASPAGDKAKAAPAIVADKKVLKRPASNPLDVVPWKKGKPELPKTSDLRARDYKQGRIYQYPFLFRTIRKRGLYATERQFSLKKFERSEAWKLSLKAIDDYKA